MKSRYQNQIELLQGTLDMLILQTLQWGPQHGYGIGNDIRSIPANCSKWSRDLSTRRCIGWKDKAG